MRIPASALAPSPEPRHLCHPHRSCRGFASAAYCFYADDDEAGMMSVIPADAYLTRACVNTDAHPGVWASGLRNPRALVTTGRRTRSFVDRRRRGGGWREEWRATPEFLQRPWPRPSLCVRPHTRASAPSWREEGVGGRAWRVWRYVAVNCLGSAVMTRVLPPQTRSIATDGEEREGLSLDRFRDREKPTCKALVP